MNKSFYRENAKKAIADDKLQAAISLIQDRLGKGILNLWKEKPEMDELRNRVKAAKNKNLKNLDILLAQLADSVEARGGHVFFAETAEEARLYTIELAKRRHVKLVVKGKSMLSAEIKIDQALVDAGIEHWETDLGEYLVQLDEDIPSHIIAPAVHMNREHIGDLLAKRIGMPLSYDPPTLTLAARKALRRKFLKADMGITGCNIAIAETGQISLVSNEGNIRMAGTMPPIHVALMGMERIVANMQEHKDMLQLLTLGAAIQKISTYVSFNGGPVAEGCPDGPQEFHLIIIDNGRSKILADETFSEILNCIRCGACLNVCPVYGKIGGHSYNRATCSGPIGAVIEPLLNGINAQADLCKGETLCGACLKACPVKNDIHRMLLALREKLAYGDEKWAVEQQNPLEELAFRGVGAAMVSPGLWHTGEKVVRAIMKKKPHQNNMVTAMSGPGRAWTEDRDLPPIAEKSFARLWKEKLENRPLPTEKKEGSSAKDEGEEK